MFNKKTHIKSTPLKDIYQVKRFLYECSCCIDPDMYFDYAKCKINQTALESLVDVVYIKYNQRGQKIHFESEINEMISRYLKCFALFKDSEDLTQESFNNKYGVCLEDRGMNIIKLYCVSFIRYKNGYIDLGEFKDYIKCHVLYRNMHDPCEYFKQYYCNSHNILNFCY